MAPPSSAAVVAIITMVRAVQVPKAGSRQREPIRARHGITQRTTPPPIAVITIDPPTSRRSGASTKKTV